MPGSTKARFNEIQAEAMEIASAVGFRYVDSLTGSPELSTQLRGMEAELVARTECHKTTAARHIAKALRRQRNPAYPVENGGWGWGGKRPYAGAPEGNKNAKKKEAA